MSLQLIDLCPNDLGLVQNDVIQVMKNPLLFPNVVADLAGSNTDVEAMKLRRDALLLGIFTIDLVAASAGNSHASVLAILEQTI
jgi:hypothetical protein